MRLDVRVDPDEALGYLGYAGQPLDADLAARLGRARSQVERLSPQGLVRVFPVAGWERDEEGVPCRVVLKGCALALEGRDIAAHLKGARQVALLVATLGLASETLIRRATMLSATDGLLVDACASSLAEAAVEALDAMTAERALADGFVATGRFSPGYGDFPLASQQLLLDATGAGRALGVSATKGHLLVPSKSVTAVVGLLPRGASAPANRLVESQHQLDCAEAGRSDEGRFGEGRRASAGGKGASRTCGTCPLAAHCLLRTQGRTCYGR